jgi:glycerol 3-phosphatase-2
MDDRRGDLGRFCHWLARHRGELDALVLDIDGVLVAGSRPTARAAELLGQVRGLGLPLRLLTNDGNNSLQEKARRLQTLGLEVDPREITSAGLVLQEVARRRGLVGERCFLVGRLGEPCFAEAAGIRVTRSLEELPRCRAVLLGEDDYPWEPVINGVINFLARHPEAPLIVPNPDPYYPVEDGGLRVAAGGVAGLVRLVLARYGVVVKPLFLGKPHPPIFRCNHRDLERQVGRRILRRRVLLLGDSLPSDVRGARAFGYRSALVLTGATTAARLVHSRIRPDLVFHGL